MKDNNYIPRPVRLLDLVVVGVGFIHNIASSIETLTGELMELAIYQSNHLTQTNRAVSYTHLTLPTICSV